MDDACWGCGGACHSRYVGVSAVRVRTRRRDNGTADLAPPGAHLSTENKTGRANSARPVTAPPRAGGSTVFAPPSRVRSGTLLLLLLRCVIRVLLSLRRGLDGHCLD